MWLLCFTLSLSRHTGLWPSFCFWLSLRLKQKQDSWQKCQMTSVCLYLAWVDLFSALAEKICWMFVTCWQLGTSGSFVCIRMIRFSIYFEWSGSVEACTFWLKEAKDWALGNAYKWQEFLVTQGNWWSFICVLNADVSYHLFLTSCMNDNQIICCCGPSLLLHGRLTQWIQMWEYKKFS